MITPITTITTTKKDAAGHEDAESNVFLSLLTNKGDFISSSALNMISVYINHKTRHGLLHIWMRDMQLEMQF